MWDTLETTHEGTEEEHELELCQLEQHEEQEKKKRNISLKEKVDECNSSDDENDTDDMSLFVKKFNKFLKRNKSAKSGQAKKFIKNNDASNANQNFTCFGCAKPGHIKMDCPNLKKISFKGKNDTKTGPLAFLLFDEVKL
ncbi:hypothetical protein Lal_00033070 [Lupinus albus]|nr:hypothetical protein Lal_00033070 [Lupinus albus]